MKVDFVDDLGRLGRTFVGALCSATEGAFMGDAGALFRRSPSGSISGVVLPPSAIWRGNVSSRDVRAGGVGAGSGGVGGADEAEDKAAAVVQKLGGVVIRDDRAPGKPVVMVNLGSAKISDVGLKELAPLKSLTKLILASTPVTDAG